MRYYEQPCNVCGQKIPHTNKRGRPRVRCGTCPAPKIKRIVPDHYDNPCELCGSAIVRTGYRGRPPKFCTECASVFSRSEDEVPF